MPHRSPRLVRVLTALLVAAGTMLVGAAGAQAADDPPRLTWSIQPATAQGIDARPWFNSAVMPGDERVEYVGVSNRGDAPVTLDLYAADGRTSTDGSFTLGTRSDPRTDVGSWISLKQLSVTVPARSRTDVPISIRVPVNATPGDHLGGIVASLTTPSTTAAGTAVSVEQRVGTRVYLRVAGDLRPGVAIEDLTSSYAASPDPTRGGTTTVRYHLRNTGNARLSVDHALEVSGLLGFGRTGVAVPRIRELAPGSTVEVVAEVSTGWPLVRSTTEVTAYAVVLGSSPAPGVEATTATATSWALPWVQFSVVALLGVVSFLLARALRRRSERAREVRDAELTAAREEGRAEAWAGQRG